MRKSLVVIVFSSFLLLFFPVCVYAQNSVSGQNEEGFVALAGNNYELQKKDMERKATQEAKVEQIRQTRIRSYWQVLEKRLSATINRLEILISRIESRLSKISNEDPGLDISSVQNDIDDAKVMLTDAKTKLDSASSDLGNILNTNNPKQAFEIIRVTIKDIKNSIVEVHRLLVHVIGNIKGLRVGSYKTPTIKLSPTPTINVTPTLKDAV